MPKYSNNAFTPIELLAVIAVIALFTSMPTCLLSSDLELASPLSSEESEDENTVSGSAVGVSARTMSATRDERSVRRWIVQQENGVRIVGSFKKRDMQAPALLRVVADGAVVWSTRLDPANGLRHAFDIAVPGLPAKSVVDFVLSTDAHSVEIDLAFAIIPEPFVSKWEPSLPSGYPEWTLEAQKVLRESGQDVLQQIRNASLNGLGHIRIEPGDYLFNANWSHASTLTGLKDLEIIADGATFWFEPPVIHGLLFKNCSNVRVRGLTIDFTIPIFSQARITMIDRQKKSLRAELLQGYAPLDSDGELEISGERKLIFYDQDGRFINHRHTRSHWRLSKDEKTIIYDEIRVNPIPTNLKVGDWVVSPIQTGAALRSVESAGMLFEDVNIWSSPGMAVYEGQGEGGHIYRRVRATRRPHTNRLHAFGADVFHLSACDRGPTLERCESAYGADDNINIHGRFGRVIEATTAKCYYLDGVFELGDQLEFRDDSSLDLLGRAEVVSVTKVTSPPVISINERYDAKGDSLVELDRELELPPLTLIVLDGKRSADGFIIRDCWFHDNFQRTLINGAPNGLIENTTFQNVGHGINVQFETWGPWMEGPFARNLVVRNNRFLRVSPLGTTFRVSMHPKGGGTTRRRIAAKPVENLLFEGNLLDAASGYPLKVHNVNGLIIRNNYFEKASRDGILNWVTLQDCANVEIYNNRPHAND